MLERISPLTELRHALAAHTTPAEVATAATLKVNSNASRNTYIHFNQQELLQQAQSLAHTYANAARPPLYGVPVSLKDCFDLADTITTFGSRFYADHNLPATHDSAMAHRLRASGCLITGKTHLHPLAYGITGQNPDYGDCLQPRDSSLLTGGSSSGAAASVQEGSALAAIGTDTGGSIRVPAALCGLTGYRASHALASTTGQWPNAWTGAAHLAPSFDTVGFLLRDPRDAAAIANALFSVPFATAPSAPRIGCVPLSFLTDCESDVLAAFDAWRRQLTRAGASLAEFDTTSWNHSIEIFAPIQAHEAAAQHRGHYDQFEPIIAQRLHWGASLSDSDLAPLRQRLADFRSRMASAFDKFDFLMLPCAPVSRLVANQDQSSARQTILRYTIPFSLAGLPVVTLPAEIIGAAFGAGIQLAASPGNDGALLAYAATLAQALVDHPPSHA
ncbi:aspartyl-tRNA(Asn)/glutamyl-tRNA(Gln) amidotransferase subunit A [Edaphobacter aggregans]|uniref:Aspartyl-tRNA(Asn)/glutamyl-tRNA(Gln) amidotransferase subunit A n=1 Tax=Edaphobacter aggregans TaxID=570835 RepID=A0A428MLN2_9BACT|nr:amidase [Edaphobacter aggregans]RSL17776.1 aspartyl-tRNA(Asn)/glutamyl-tRNA(Gln) amidotransferase subunit A [Edaphobacter aggregans]